MKDRGAVPLADPHNEITAGRVIDLFLAPRV